MLDVITQAENLGIVEENGIEWKLDYECDPCPKCGSQLYSSVQFDSIHLDDNPAIEIKCFSCNFTDHDC